MFASISLLIIFFEFIISVKIQTKPICVIHNLLAPIKSSFCEILLKRPNSMVSISQRHDSSLSVTTNMLESLYQFPSRTNVVVGASTIKTKEQALSLIQAGVSFLSTTKFSSEILEVCLRRNIPLVCGVQSLEECTQAIASGATQLKIYPFVSFSEREIQKMIQNIRRLRPSTQIFAAGGVSTTNIPKIVELGFDNVAVGRDVSSSVSIDAIFDDFELISKLWGNETKLRRLK